MIRRFTREMEAAGRVDHPNVIRASDAGEESGILFLAMDLLDGATIDQLILAHGPLPVSDACEIARQIALGLEAIRAKDLVHRDLKPSNVMVTRDGVVKILDLGLARLRDDESNIDERTPSGTLMGTFDYQAPEQATQAHSVTIQADLYSLACTIHKMLAGSVPFANAKSPAQKIQAHASRPFPELPESVPLAVRNLVLQLADKTPERRGRPAAVAKALAEWAGSANLKTLVATAGVRPQTTIDRGSADTAGSALDARIDTVTHDSPDARKTRRFAPPTRIFSVLLAVAFVAAIAGVAAVALRIDPNAAVVPEKLPAANLVLPKANPENLDPGFTPETLEPLVWHSLLQYKPRDLFWHNRAGTSRRDYDVRRKELWVNADHACLFGLAQSSGSGFRFQLAMGQPSWKGGCGVFFGIICARGVASRPQQTLVRVHARIYIGNIPENDPNVPAHPDHASSVTPVNDTWLFEQLTGANANNDPMTYPDNTLVVWAEFDTGTGDERFDKKHVFFKGKLADHTDCQATFCLI